MKRNYDFIENVHYYLEDGKVVFTEKYLSEKNKHCCGNKCRHCPFVDKWKKGAVEKREIQ